MILDWANMILNGATKSNSAVLHGQLGDKLKIFLIMCGMRTHLGSVCVHTCLGVCAHVP